jgi:hypothetical protein
MFKQIVFVYKYLYFFPKSYILNNRPPLPPNATPNQKWENNARHHEIFMSSSKNLSPQPTVTSGSFLSHDQLNQTNPVPFINQAQASGITPIRRPVPLPGNSNLNASGRNMSASVFNINQSGTYNYPPSYQQNQWNFTPVNQVCFV